MGERVASLGGDRGSRGDPGGGRDRSVRQQDDRDGGRRIATPVHRRRRRPAHVVRAVHDRHRGRAPLDHGAALRRLAHQVGRPGRHPPHHLHRRGQDLERPGPLVRWVADRGNAVSGRPYAFGARAVRDAERRPRPAVLADRLHFRHQAASLHRRRQDVADRCGPRAGRGRRRGRRRTGDRHRGLVRRSGAPRRHLHGVPVFPLPFHVRRAPRPARCWPGRGTAGGATGS